MNKINRRGLAMMLYAIYLRIIANDISIQIVALVLGVVGFFSLFLDWED